MIRTIRKGYTVEVNGDVYTVAGTMKLRGTYYYIMQGVIGRISFKREALLAGQSDGSVVVRG